MKKICAVTISLFLVFLLPTLVMAKEVFVSVGTVPWVRVISKSNHDAVNHTVDLKGYIIEYDLITRVTKDLEIGFGLYKQDTPDDPGVDTTIYPFYFLANYYPFSYHQIYLTGRLGIVTMHFRNRKIFSDLSGGSPDDDHSLSWGPYYAFGAGYRILPRVKIEALLAMAYGSEFYGDYCIKAKASLINPSFGMRVGVSF